MAVEFRLSAVLEEHAESPSSSESEDMDESPSSSESEDMDGAEGEFDAHFVPKLDFPEGEEERDCVVVLPEYEVMRPLSSD